MGVGIQQHMNQRQPTHTEKFVLKWKKKQRGKNTGMVRSVNIPADICNSQPILNLKYNAWAFTTSPNNIATMIK